MVGWASERNVLAAPERHSREDHGVRRARRTHTRSPRGDAGDLLSHLRRRPAERRDHPAVARSTSRMKPKNTICLWYDKDAEDAARFYAATFPNSEVTAVRPAPGDFPGGKKGDVLTV